MEIKCIDPRHIISISIIFLYELMEVFICNANAFCIGNNGKSEQTKYTLDMPELTGADINASDGTITYRSFDREYVTCVDKTKWFTCCYYNIMKIKKRG